METMTRRHLLAQGFTDRQLRAAVQCGEMIRVRIGHYAAAGLDAPTVSAVRLHGRLACVSELRRRGVWVLDSVPIHVEVPRSASRLRLAEAHFHWRRSQIFVEDRVHVSITESLIQASRCLGRAAWIASVDSALHQRLIGRNEMDAIRAGVRRDRVRLLDLADPKAESGLESIVRLLAVDLGFRVRSQVRVPGVGRVDLVVEDWIVVETDGSAFHDVALTPRDRRRDATLAATGRSVLRPGYSLTVFDRRAVALQLIGAVAAHRRVKNAGHLAARARDRLVRLDLS